VGGWGASRRRGRGQASAALERQSFRLRGATYTYQSYSDLELWGGGTPLSLRKEQKGQSEETRFTKVPVLFEVKASLKLRTSSSS